MMTRNMSHPTLQTKETKEMKESIEMEKPDEKGAMIEEPIIQFDTMPTILTPEKPLEESKSRD